MASKSNTRRIKHHLLIPRPKPYTVELELPTVKDVRFAKQLFSTHPIGVLVKEVVETAYKIYTDLLEEDEPVTIVCGGQSPAYYCFCMTQFKIYNPEKVNVIVVPYSSGREVWDWEESMKNAANYCARLEEWTARNSAPIIHNSLVYLDYIESGRGVFSIRRTLRECFKGVERHRIFQLAADPRYGRVRDPAIFAGMGIAKSYITEAVYLVSEFLPRIVRHYPPKEFSVEGSLEPYFVGITTNKFLPIFQQCAEKYPKIPVERTEWYRANEAPLNITLQGPRSRSKSRRSTRKNNTH